MQIASVIQDAVIDVHEEGSEAAAVTGVAIPTSAVEPQDPIEFRADRPFLFAIRDRATQSLLFLAGVADPRGTSV